MPVTSTNCAPAGTGATDQPSRAVKIAPLQGVEPWQVKAPTRPFASMKRGTALPRSVTVYVRGRPLPSSPPLFPSPPPPSPSLFAPAPSFALLTPTPLSVFALPPEPAPVPDPARPPHPATAPITIAI